MQKYKILDTIFLGFLTYNDSYEMFIEPGDGYISFNGHDIVFVDTKGVEHISHTQNHAIDVWLEKGCLEATE